MKIWSIDTFWLPELWSDKCCHTLLLMGTLMTHDTFFWLHRWHRSGKLWPSTMAYQHHSWAMWRWWRWTASSVAWRPLSWCSSTWSTSSWCLYTHLTYVLMTGVKTEDLFMFQGSCLRSGQCSVLKTHNSAAEKFGCVSVWRPQQLGWSTGL